MREVLLSYLDIEDPGEDNLEEVVDGFFEDIEDGSTYTVHTEKSYAELIESLIQEKVVEAQDELYKLVRYSDSKQFFYLDYFALEEYYLENKDMLFDEDTEIAYYEYNNTKYIIIING